MKIDSNEFRNNYINALKGKLDSNANEIVITTLDKVLSEFNNEKNIIVNELSNMSKYSHGIFGNFGKGGHCLIETLGPNPLITSYADSGLDYEAVHTEMFKDEDRYSPEFNARILGNKVNDGYVLRLTFNDRQLDIRPGSHTDYTLFIPTCEVNRIIPFIKENPETLVKVFQKVFHNYDRSKGKLAIDVDNTIDRVIKIEY